MSMESIYEVGDRVVYLPKKEAGTVSWISEKLVFVVFDKYNPKPIYGQGCREKDLAFENAVAQ